MSHKKRLLEEDQHKLYSLKPRNANNTNLNYFDNSILFKKHRSRSRARNANEDLNWLLANKQNDYEMLKDLLYSSFINQTNKSRTHSHSMSSSSSDSHYYKTRPIEFLDENVFFEDEPKLDENKQNLIEIRSPSPPEEFDHTTIEALIEELDAELKKSLDSSLSSSPIVNNNHLTTSLSKSGNKCSCQIVCNCQCHNSSSVSNHFRFGSNSSSITSSRNSSSLLLHSNSPCTMRRISHESLEWDISLDNQISSPRLSILV